jgi:hypothetical protein
MRQADPSLHGTRLLLIGLLTLAVVAAVAALPRISQNPEYHHFADQRTFLGVPNFFNVISNAPFILLGGFGLWLLLPRRSPTAESDFLESAERWPYVIFFLGVVLIGFGSAYYHLAPENERLVWDRMPITIAFMAMLASVITERIDVKTGLFLLFPLVILGICSVMYWRFSEQQGVGDLRPYVAIYVTPILLIPLMLLLFPPRYSQGGSLWGVFALYTVAVISEVFDKHIFSFGQIVSGHTLKHLFAAAAVSWVLLMLRKRHPL